ncbi:hypothetical protein [Roseobacter sp. HKCCA0434]|uniref:hypothetical protein n=1 Tax=Roseobacter sp. HKCCA0434 TaxID=3079297 RepID=UPI002905965C|nr:hypothetical protein [Roseobacter sp. HKCCA0434]
MGELLGEFLDFGTFSSFWYWLFLALAWSSRTHWTIGIPFDSVARAEKRGGRWAEDVDRIAAAMGARFASFGGRGGVWIAGIVTFLLSGLMTAAFLYNNELSRGILAIALPMIVAEIGDIRLALKVERTGLSGHDLRRALVWRRFLNQVTGLGSLVLASALAILTILQRESLVGW